MSAPSATSTPERADRPAFAPLGLEHASVAVLSGGRSSEREVSLASGRRVLAALRTPSAEADLRGPARVIDVEITPGGLWRFGARTLLHGEALLALSDVDCVFLALHGGEGENGALQGFLTCADVPFTGSGVIASAVAMDKVFARELVRAAGLVVPLARCLARAGRHGPEAELLAELGGACVVKPRRGGSSVACALARTPDELARALEAAFREGPQVLVEELVRGVEVTGAVLEKPGETPEGEALALPPVEIRPRGEFFDYHEKYAEDGALELCPPESLDEPTATRVEERALAAHRVLSCAGYSRSDFIVRADGEPVFLETNTLPGLAPRSLLPRAAAAVGIDYRTLCLWITARGRALGEGRRGG